MQKGITKGLRSRHSRLGQGNQTKPSILHHGIYCRTKEILKKPFLYKKIGFICLPFILSGCPKEQFKNIHAEASLEENNIYFHIPYTTKIFSSVEFPIELSEIVVQDEKKNKIVWRTKLENTAHIINQPEKISYGQKFTKYNEITPPEKLDLNKKYTFSADGTSNSKDNIFVTTYAIFCLKEINKKKSIINLKDQEECPSD